MSNNLEKKEYKLITIKKHIKENIFSDENPLGRYLFSGNSEIILTPIIPSIPLTNLTDTRDNVAQQIARLQIKNAELATDNKQLKDHATHLEATVQQLEMNLAQARKDVQRSIRQNQDLRVENAQLNSAVQQLREQTQRATKEDLLDPKGYCKALGIDPRLVGTLSSDKLEKLLTSVYRAYSRVHHPDIGGDADAMKAVNVAYDFLKDPQKRRTYGRQ